MEPNIVFRSDDNATIQALVAADYGVALMPRLTVDLADARVSAVPLDDLFAPRALGIGWHRDRHRQPAIDAFLDLARTLCPVIAERHAGTPRPGAGGPRVAAKSAVP